MIVGRSSGPASGKYATLSRVSVTGRVIPSGPRSRESHAPAATTTACASLAPQRQRALRLRDPVRIVVDEPEDPRPAVARPARMAELELLQDDRLVPRARERVRRCGAHDAGADDDDLGALGHGGPMLLARVVARLPLPQTRVGTE